MPKKQSPPPSSPPPPPPRPTDGELAILSVLWERGPSTVRQVHQTLSDANPEKPIGYTTILKLMQIMAEKKLATRDQSQRSHIYHAAVSEDSTQQHLARDLSRKAFGGSTSKLVMQALAADKTTPQELQQIRDLLDQLQGGKK